MKHSSLISRPWRGWRRLGCTWALGTTGFVRASHGGGCVVLRPGPIAGTKTPGPWACSASSAHPSWLCLGKLAPDSTCVPFADPDWIKRLLQSPCPFCDSPVFWALAVRRWRSMRSASENGLYPEEVGRARSPAFTRAEVLFMAINRALGTHPGSAWAVPGDKHLFKVTECRDVSPSEMDVSPYSLPSDQHFFFKCLLWSSLNKCSIISRSRILSSRELG